MCPHLEMEYRTPSLPLVSIKDGPKARHVTLMKSSYK